MKNDCKIFIGIDPDVDRSGYAIWDSENKSFDIVTKLSFWNIIEDFESWNIPITVVVESGHLIKKSNWHKSQGRTAEKISKNVGQNHQVGILLIEYCKHKNIKVLEVKPKGKINSQTFKNITGYTGRTNQEKRDAGMLVFGMK